MASNETNSEHFQLSVKQLESIQQTVLNSVLQILPKIITDLTPKILESAEELMKDSISKMMSIASDALNKTVQTIEVESRDFEETHKRTLNQKLKARSDIFWTFTRSTEMAKLYSDRQKEEPPYVPRKFREENARKGSQEEIAVCDKLSEHKLSAEIEILQLRAQENERKLTKIDDEANEVFKSKVQDEDVLKQLKGTWEKKAKDDETVILKRWEKRIKEKKTFFKKINQTKIKAQSLRTKDKQVQQQITTTAQTADHMEDQLIDPHNGIRLYNTSQLDQEHRISCLLKAKQQVFIPLLHLTSTQPQKTFTAATYLSLHVPYR